MNNKEIISLLEEIGIVPVVKLNDTTKALSLAKALIDGGINCAEVTFRAEGADKVISQISKAYPNMMIGAGTVLTCEQADLAIKSGAKFVVSPGLNPNVVKHCIDKGIFIIPGVSSASEIECALELSLSYLKFFPAEQAGGLPYIKALCAPYSSVRFMPTGGVNENNLNDYLAYEKVFACGGSWMVTPALTDGGKWEEITAISRAAVNKMLGFEVAHIGINCEDSLSALNCARLFEEGFGFAAKEGNSSVFASSGIELMKSKYLGASGHIAIKTNSVSRALYTLRLRGFEADMSTAKYDEKGKLLAVYLTKDFGGFAVHLLQKK